MTPSLSETLKYGKLGCSVKIG